LFSPAVSYAEEYPVSGAEFVAIGEASAKIKSVLKMLGIPSDLIRRASVIAYEAEMNLVVHGGGGTMKLEISPEGISIWAVDSGPGIEDIDKAMTEGFSTASERVRAMGFGAGMGLPNIKRNSDAMELKSEIGKGTTLKADIFLQKT
jgi:anti-sigma regulatory factor (Ser/Thr protein kinase)